MKDANGRQAGPTAWGGPKRSCLGKKHFSFLPWESSKCFGGWRSNSDIGERRQGWWAFFISPSLADQEAGTINLMARAETLVNLFSSPFLFFGDTEEWEASQVLPVRQPQKGRDPGWGVWPWSSGCGVVGGGAIAMPVWGIRWQSVCYHPPWSSQALAAKEEWERNQVKSKIKEGTC